MVLDQLWQSLNVLGTFQPSEKGCVFAKRLSRSKDIKRDERRVFHYVDQHESFQVTQK